MLEKSTYYILDAQGNQMSMYEHDVKAANVDYYLTERNIYGSSRLGTTRDTINMFLPNTLPSYGVVGNRNYELSNHLGNVLAVINDVIYPIVDHHQNITSYETGLLQVSDYSPFGVQLDGRTISNGDYRYGFNGMEKDDEVKGAGNSYTTEFRQYDPRVGRWLSIDPLKYQMPWISPYAVNFNNPIIYNDIDGDIPWPTILKGMNFGKREGGNAFGIRFHPIHKKYKNHRGIDLAAPEGTKIRTVAAGTVIRSGFESNGFGNQVWIDHGKGYVTVYAHMVNLPSVSKGDIVSNGQVVGEVGTTGSSTGNHLHFELHKDGTHIDPTSIYDLNEEINGVPYKLDEKEASEWKAATNRRNFNSTRVGILEDRISNFKDKNKDPARLIKRLNKVQSKIEVFNSKLATLQKTHNLRLKPSIEVGELTQEIGNDK